jgi:hypothetical protein
MTEEERIVAALTDEQRNEIPKGWYCYTRLGDFDDNGRMPVKKCPHFRALPDDHARCELLKYTTEYSRELLWDQVKICGINDEWDESFEY